MDLVTFLQSNWFAISGVISIIILTWKMSRQLSDYKKEVENKDSLLDQKINETMQTLNNDIRVIKENMNESISELNKKIVTNESKRAENIERTRLIMEGVEATLHTLHDQGANGPVTKCLEEIDEYKMRKAIE